MNKTQIFKTIKSLEGFNKSIEHDSFEKSKKNADKPFQKYEFLGAWLQRPNFSAAELDIIPFPEYLRQWYVIVINNLRVRLGTPLGP